MADHIEPATDEQIASAVERVVAGTPLLTMLYDAERARDEWKARAERAEWSLREITRSLTDTRNASTDAGVHHVCDTLLASLDRLGYGPVGVIGEAE